MTLKIIKGGKDPSIKLIRKSKEINQYGWYIDINGDLHIEKLHLYTNCYTEQEEILMKNNLTRDYVIPVNRQQFMTLIPEKDIFDFVGRYPNE